MRGIFFLLVDETSLSFDGITWFIKPQIITIALIFVCSVSWSMSDVLNTWYGCFLFCFVLFLFCVCVCVCFLFFCCCFFVFVFFCFFNRWIDPVASYIHKKVKQ